MGDSLPVKTQSHISPSASPVEPYFKSLSPESRASSVHIKPEASGLSTEASRSAITSTRPHDRDRGGFVVIDATDEEDDDQDLDPVNNSLLVLSDKGSALALRAESNSLNDSTLPHPSTQANSVTAKASRKRMPINKEGTTATMIREAHQQIGNQRRASLDDNDSELSEPDSNVQSPAAGDLAELDDEIVVNAAANDRRSPSHLPAASENENHETIVDSGDQDQSPRSHYPKRKRVSKFTDFKLASMDISPPAGSGESPGPNVRSRASRQTLASLKGVVLGCWRDSPVPDPENRHTVIGFIDSRDRLRTRIQRSDVRGDPTSHDYPLPPGPGGSWVTLDRIVFFQHLVGLSHVQVKEYVKLRADAVERSDEERKAAETAAVQEAIARANADPLNDGSANPLTMAYGEELPDALTNGSRSATKRRRMNGDSPAVASAVVSPTSAEPPVRLASRPAPQSRLLPGLSMPSALHGTRPTRILLGYWKGSSEADPADRHSVHGILGHNDMFRVKVTRQTRDGRYVGGNFPSGAGALWIQYEEVEFEPHLKPLSRFEVKEYCRIRQYQIDHGEVPDDRIANETKAVYEAQARVASGVHKHERHEARHASSEAPPMVSDNETPNDYDAGAQAAQPEAGTRHSKRTEKKKKKRRFSEEFQPALKTPHGRLDVPKTRGTRDEHPEVQSSESRSSSRTHAESIEKANALARKEIARVEAAQGRADRRAMHRERAAVLVADATAAAAAAAAAGGITSSSPCPAGLAAGANGRASLLHETDEMQRLNKVWARQESIRMKTGSDDAKMYDGIKYERKANGPFVGKLVSQGTIINIDGEDYVEYRVLTKPTFF